MHLDSSKNRKASTLETPRLNAPLRPMLSPPRMPSHGTGVTSNHENEGSDQNDDREEENELYVRPGQNRTSPLLDFPVMQQGRTTPLEISSRCPTRNRSSWRMSLNRETSTGSVYDGGRGRRRRASSLDESLPVPRISLRPRFTRNTSSARSPQFSNNVMAGLQDTQQQHQTSSENCSCLDCMVAALSSSSERISSMRSQDTQDEIRTRRRRPTNPSHFRSHTYSGSDTSTDIFAAAMEMERSDFVSTPPFSASNNDSVAPTIPIFHNPFELSSINHTLPISVQKFIPPSNSVSRDINRPIPRYNFPRTATGDASLITSTSAQPARHLSSTSNQPGSIASTSLGTPTCTCTISTSSVSAFDQTSPLQLQQQSPGNPNSNFQDTKREPIGTETAAENCKNSVSDKADIEKKSPLLPFDVHLLLGSEANEEEDPHKQP